MSQCNFIYLCVIIIFSMSHKIHSFLTTGLVQYMSCTYEWYEWNFTFLFAHDKCESPRHTDSSIHEEVT